MNLRERSGRISLLCLVLAVLFFTTSSVVHASPESRVSWDTGCSASHPAADNGWVVWQEQCGTDFFLKAYKYTTGEEVLLPNITKKANVPEISGNRVVWFEGTVNNPTEIYYTDLDSLPLTAHRVPAPYAENTHPGVAGNYIVWQSRLPPGFTTYDIMFFDITQPGIVTNLTDSTATSNQKYPSISGDTIVWLDDQNTPSEINLADILLLPALSILPSNPDGSSPGPPSINGDSVAWGSDSFEIFLYDSGTLTQITSYGGLAFPDSPYVTFPSMVWKDDTNYCLLVGCGTFDIVYNDTSDLLPLQTITSPSAVVSTSTDWRPRLTADNRIFWQDNRDGGPQIYMYSVGVNDPCAADFTAPAVATRNVPVHFTDQSTGTLTSHLWTFGDGTTSTLTDPDHSFTTAGTFTVTLTVSNPSCRSRTTRSVSVDDVPAASFSSNRTFGMIPLAIQFTNTSTGLQTGYLWDFGDGWTSTAANPSHTYTTKGTYTVTLTVSNAFGSSTATTQDAGAVRTNIHALDGVQETQNSSIPGVAISTVGGQPYLTFDTAQLPVYQLDTGSTVLAFTPPAGSGFQRVTLTSGTGGFTSAAGIISGPLSRSTLMSTLIRPAGFSADLGNPVQASYSLDCPGYPSTATVRTTVYDDTNVFSPHYQEFSQATHQAGASVINGIPYVLWFEKNNLPDGCSAVLNMTIRSSWVAARGGSDQMYLVRIGDDSNSQVLPLTRISQDVINGNDNFGAVSPYGLSKFAPGSLSGSVNIFQIAYLQAIGYLESGSSAASSGTSSTGGSGGQKQSSQPNQNQPNQLNPPEPTKKTADLYINDEGVVTQTTVLQSSDMLATVTIGRGVTAFDAIGHPLSSVSIESVESDQISRMPSPGALTFSGLGYNLQPDGAVFSPAITITFTVPGAQWGQQYMVREFDAGAGSWIDLPTTYHPESGTISASVSHFCCIALFSSALTSQHEAVIPRPGPAVMPESVPKHVPEKSRVEVIYDMAGFLVEFLANNTYIVLGFVAIVAVLYLRGRRGRLDRIRYNL